MINNDEDKTEEYNFGWWPEVVGIVAVAALMVFLISYADGIM